jgi:hypothetical protein
MAKTSVPGNGTDILFGFSQSYARYPSKKRFPGRNVFFKKIFENKLHILLFCGKICLAIDSPQSFSKPNHSRPTRQNGDPYVRKQRHLTTR